jgi:hypothetical protein
VNKKGSNELYTERDFNIGVDIFIYGRTYHIVSCDFYTEVLVDFSRVSLF